MRLKDDDLMSVIKAHPYFFRNNIKFRPKCLLEEENVIFER